MDVFQWMQCHKWNEMTPSYTKRTDKTHGNVSMKGNDILKDKSNG